MLRGAPRSERPRRRHGDRRPGGRALPVALLCLVAFGAGALVAASGDDDERLRVAERYLAAWSRGDWTSMHGLVAPADRRRVPLDRFRGFHEDALGLATATRVRPGMPVEEDEGVFRVPVAVDTRIFGTVRQPITLRVVEEDDRTRVNWERALVFPGLRRGEALGRSLRMPPRAALLAREGEVLAEGPERAPGIDPALASSIVGVLGDAPAERRDELRRLGVPPGTPVGLSGLERAFDLRLLGTPGGELRAGRRVLAAKQPLPGRAVRTTLDLDVQRTAVAALGDQAGGVAVLRPRSGEITALAGVAFSALQPPGSTFKIVTLAAGLESGVVRSSDRFPVETSTTLSNVEIENADREACGGTLTYSFAHSCNSVFAPLGARLGGRRLEAMAERFGFNQDPGIPGAATSVFPPASELDDDYILGATAIGQGAVQASALQMAAVAGTIANEGRRPPLTLDRDERTEGSRASAGRRVVAASTARTVGRMMRAVVTDGTGTRAAIDGVPVAGKTGTAEIRNSVTCKPDPEAGVICPPVEDDPTDTDAWFAAYAPHGDPRVAVAVLLIANGRGGETAAPVARALLQAAL